MKILFFFFCMLILESGVIYGQRKLQVGDTVPDVVVHGLIDFKTPEVKLSDFKGKLLILDFWATWCGACIANFPKHDSLSKQFAGRLLFLPVTSEPESVVVKFREKYEKQYKRQISGPLVVGDTVLRKMFNYRYLPHYVWIDEDGVIKYITEGSEVTAKNILSVLEKDNIALKEKKDLESIPYDNEKPLLVNNNGGDGSALTYHTLLTRYTPGLSGGFSWRIDTVLGTKITVTNASRMWLYKVAFARPGTWLDDGSIITEVKDPSLLTTNLSGAQYLSWLSDGNGFCYEIIAPKALHKKVNAIMQRDMENFFPEYSVAMEKRTQRCLVLTLMNGATPLKKSAGGKPLINLTPYGWEIKNTSVGKLVERMNLTQNYPLTIVDQTGNRDLVDMEINIGLSDLTRVNVELSRYGLMFVEKDVEKEMLVIKDAVVQSTAD